MARFLLTTVGTAGDVFPFVALARALKRRGHHVGLLANPYFEPRVLAAGVSFLPLGTEEGYRQAVSSPEIWDPRRGLPTLMERLLPPLEESYASLVGHLKAETVVLTHPFFFAARIAREILPNTCITLLPSPMLLRSNYQSPVLHGDRDLESMARPLKRLMWWMADRFYLDRIIGRGLNEMRKELGLSRISRPFNGWLFSPDQIIGLFPAWFAPVQPDWPNHLSLSGFLLSDRMEGLSPEVARFLDAGSAPVVFTPATGVTDLERFRTAARECCRHLQVRGLFLAMDDDEGSVEGFFCSRFAPLLEVLPRARALVHFGGIGTAAAAIATATPQLVIPRAYDQPDNAARITRLGLGRRLLFKEFDTQCLSCALEQIFNDEKMAARCQEFAARIEERSNWDEICVLVEGT